MVNYENGKIYRIICNETGKQYIGATTIPLSARLSQHKKLYKNLRTCLSREVLEGGNYGIYLIEDCPCDRKEQLLSRERYFIETTECVNKKVPLRTKHEWYTDNKERIIENQCIWNSNNPEKVKEYKRRYMERLRNYDRENPPSINLEDPNVDLNVTLYIDEFYKKLKPVEDLPRLNTFTEFTGNLHIIESFLTAP